MKSITSLFIILCCGLFALGQESNKETEKMIGSPMPNYAFEKVRKSLDVTSPDWAMTPMSLSELQGKWSILYFWTRNCTPCINSFPKFDKFRKTYNKELNVLLIGQNNEWNLGIKDFFAGVSLVQKIDVPITFDTVLVNKMKISYSGTALLIDPKGILRHVVMGSDLTEKELKKIIAKKE